MSFLRYRDIAVRAIHYKLSALHFSGMVKQGGFASSLFSKLKETGWKVSMSLEIYRIVNSILCFVNKNLKVTANKEN